MANPRREKRRLDHLIQGTRRFSFPANGALTKADIGKLLQDNGDGTAAVYATTAPVYGTTTLTIDQPSSAAAPAVQATFDLTFHGNPANNEVFSVRAGGSVSQFTFKTSPGADNPELCEVQIGLTVADSIANLVTRFATCYLKAHNKLNIATGEPGADKVSFTLGSAIVGTAGNVSLGDPPYSNCTATFLADEQKWSSGTGASPAPYLNGSETMEFTGAGLITVTNGGDRYLGPDNGVAAIVASNIAFGDDLNGTLFNITAGDDWTPGETPSDDADAIAAVVEPLLTAAGYALTRAGEGDDQIVITDAQIRKTTLSVGSSGEAFATFDPVTNGIGDYAHTIALGKMVGLADGLATIEAPNGAAVVTNAAVSKGDKLIPRDNGQVGPKPADHADDDDYYVGVATEDTAAGTPVTMGYCPAEPYLFQANELWSTDLPATPEEALDRLLHYCKNPWDGGPF